MTGAFTDDFKELVRTQTDLVSLVSECVALQPRRGGREFVGLCPFHDDHSPSFCVYPDRQSYRCWACQEGGDCFAFVMKHEHVAFREALEMLAQRAHIPLPAAFRPPSAEEAESKSRSYEVLGWAENEFHQCLLHAPAAAPARAYLSERHIGPEMTARFHLGFHPNDWQWLQNRARNRFSVEDLLKVRLVAERDPGPGAYDLFVDRVMFPIHDARGRAVGFGGRVLPGVEGAKYLNSADHPLFNKSKLLYGLDVAREAIVKQDAVVVMEGYTDCISAHQCGVNHVVATLGTALTESHVVALKRFARKVVLVYDGDSAGQKATARALPMFLTHEIDLRILSLPGGLDPADYLADFGPEAFQALLAQAAEAWEHKYRATVATIGLDSIDSRHRVLQDMLDVLARVGAADQHGLSSTWQQRENVIIGRLAQRLSLSEQFIRQELDRLRRDGRARTPTATARADASASPSEPLFPQHPTRDEWMQRELVQIALQAPAAVTELRQVVAPSDFSLPGMRALLEVCLELTDQQIELTYERLTSRLEDPHLKQLAAHIDQHARELGVGAHLVPLAVEYWRGRRESVVPAPHVPASSPGPLDEDTRRRLQSATEKHLKRMPKKTIL